MRGFLVISILILLALGANAQHSRHLTPLYDGISPYYHPRGLHFAPGITYMWPSEWSRDSELMLPGDTMLQASVEARGSVGLYLEVGHAHFMPQWWFIDYIDYGIHFKMLRGRETINGEFYEQDTRELIDAFERNSNFSESFIGLYLNLNKFIQIREYQWLTVGAGINGDYRIISNRSSDPEFLLNDRFPDDLMVQAHAKLGYAFKLQENLFFMPSLEIPFLTALPYEKGRTTMPYFNSYYRPVMLTLRFQWLTRKKPEDCVGRPDKPSGHQLWDGKMKGFRKKR